MDALPTPQSIQVDANVYTPLTRVVGALAWVWGWGAAYMTVLTFINTDFSLTATLKESPSIVLWPVALPYRWYNAGQVRAVVDSLGVNGGKRVGDLKVPEDCGWLHGLVNNLKAGPTYCRIVASLNRLKKASPEQRVDPDAVLQCAS